MMTSASKPELLAPAGDWDALKAAVSHGANAVYFGLPAFNARHRATNFTLEELPEVFAYLRARNARGYVTLNTLIFSDELPHVVKAIECVARAGANAVIVQDLGLARLIKRMVPEMPVHASTQMTLTEPRGIEYAKQQLGIDRVILARELSIAEIEKITQQTTMPLEVFVHGALCVAYSGQCLTSEAIGGRSANRGQCAQACRMPYEMFVDGKQIELGDQAYLLSPQDLAAYEVIDQLVRLGIVSLKIEGRLKGPEYVAVTTQTYRKAIEAAESTQNLELSHQELLDLQQSFSRGFVPGFLDGVNHQRLVSGRFPKTRGVKVGMVIGHTKRGVLVELDATHPNADWLQPGDGLVFDQANPEEPEQGGRIFQIQPRNNRGQQPTFEVIFHRESVVLSEVEVGSHVYRTDDPTLAKRLEQRRRANPLRHSRGLTATFTGVSGENLTVTVQDQAGFSTTVVWEGPLEIARKHPFDESQAFAQFGRLGDTCYQLTEVHLELADAVMIPKSVLNSLRREAIEQLENQREQAVRERSINSNALAELRESIPLQPADCEDSTPPQSYVLARNLTQLETLLAWQPEEGLPRPTMVYCDFEDLRLYRDAVERCRAANFPVGLATLRVTKPGEEGFLRQIDRYAPDAILLRSLTALDYFQGSNYQLIGDFSLNVANELTADLLQQSGCHRLVPSYDLNWEQLAALLSRSQSSLFEVVAHHHMPMFHMEHCVFAHVLSEGKDYRDCGRPCEAHQVELRDRSGNSFPLLADTGCRNTLYNNHPQSAIEYLSRLKGKGVRHFRIELLRETSEEIPQVLERYTKVLAGTEAGKASWKKLQVLHQIGLTRGTFQLS